MGARFILCITTLLCCSVASAQQCSPISGDDCNANGVADSCDTGSGTSLDCNFNTIPDECELGSTEIVITPTSIKFIRTNDCNMSGVPDDCKADCDNSDVPDVCKDDLNQDQQADACALKSECQGQCNASFVLFDEDQDGVSNCQELNDHTAACDSGSFVPRLNPAACGGPNGFFNQVNIATVVNQLSRSMHVRAEYRDAGGVVRGSAEFNLPANLKRDLIVNDLGLTPNSYGTFCIYTDATTLGAWSGGITIYKRRTTESSGFSGTEPFDYALFYPFSDPLNGPISIPLNTNTIGTNGLGTVANWIRITDATTGDNELLTGTLRYFNAAGALVASDLVSIPNGGRLDFGGHEKLPPGAVGLAQFVPSNNGLQYYLEVTRYFYEGVGSGSDRFYTAFPVPVHQPTGAPVTGEAYASDDELSIFEFVNANETPSNVELKVFDYDGGPLLSQAFAIPGKGTIHRVITNELRSLATSPASAQIKGARESIDSTTVVYSFDSLGNLEYGYAPQFNQSPGTKQFTEFNSFINHESVLETINTTDGTIRAHVTVINFDQTVITDAGFDLVLPPRASDRRQLSLPKDTYGTIIVDSGSDLGLVVRNDVSRSEQYVLPFFGR